MNEYDVKRLALILAIQAEIDGMKAINQQRQHCGQGIAYTEEAFIHAAQDLRAMSRLPNDQLDRVNP